LQATKNLLVRVHRPYSLNLVYHEELAALRALEDRWDVRAMTRSIVEFGSSLVLLMILYTGARESTLIHWCIGIMVVMTAVAMWANGRIRFYLRSAQVYLLRLRNTLYACAEYIPPEDRPSRKMTAEEIAAWRASMDTLEHGVAEQKRRGEDVKAADVHDARVQPDGVLPPL
ncbi:MAG: hypothetical protein Q7R80_02820, partial [bacterium]|nr:hypothetical protein [bacterium]